MNDTIRGGQSSSHFVVTSSAGSNLATFSGRLDIAALGGAGFASQATTFESARLRLPSSTYSGLSLSLSLPERDDIATSYAGGHDEKAVSEPSKPTKFVLVLKNVKPETRPDGRRESVISYEFEFDVEELIRAHRGGGGDTSISFDEGEKGRPLSRVAIEAEWKDFKATYRGRPKEDAHPLDPSDIYELSFMCRSNFGGQAGPFSLDMVSLSAIESTRPRARVGWVDFVSRTWDRFGRWLSQLRTWAFGRRRDGSVRLE